MMKAGTKIRIRMLEKGVSGADIARTMHVDRTAVYHVIAGRSKSPKLRKAIARALGVRVSDLWPNNGNGKKAA
jgi:lambda repressor-like predicted transcriptional regulator